MKHTGEIQVFKILSESGVAAGVRRIEAITGQNVLKYYENMEDDFKEAAAAAKSSTKELLGRIRHMQDEIKALKSENESLKSKAAAASLSGAMEDVKEVKGIKLLATKVDNVDMNGLRDLSDKLKGQIKEGVVLILSSKDGKVNMVASATEAALKSGAHAGNLIKALAPLVGGGGGGRPNMAQAGGKDPSGIGKVLEAVSGELEKQIVS